MSYSTETQVRAAFVGLDDLQSAVSVEDAMHAAGPVRPTSEMVPAPAHRRWTARPVWVGLAAATGLAVLVAAPLLWSRGNDAPPATDPTPTTVAPTSTSTPEVAPSTTVASGSIDPNALPNAATAGWAVVELTLPPDAGRIQWGYGPTGLPWLVTTGIHCQDALGVPRLNGTGYNGFGEPCVGEEVENPVVTYYQVNDQLEWEQSVSLFDGYGAHPIPRLGGLATLMVCETGSPAAEGCSEAIIVSNGQEWFTPAVVDDPGPLNGLVYGLSSRDGDRILIGDGGIVGGTASGEVTWFMSQDAGRTFSMAGETSNLEHFDVYTYHDEFRSIWWHADGSVSIHELSDNLDWTLIGEARGAEGVLGRCPQSECGRHVVRAISTGEGTTFLIGVGADREETPMVVGISSDGGSTWNTPEPLSTAIPFRPNDRNGYWFGASGWVGIVGDWVIAITNRGPVVSDGTGWFQLDQDAIEISRPLPDGPAVTLRFPVAPQQ